MYRNITELVDGDVFIYGSTLCVFRGTFANLNEEVFAVVVPYPTKPSNFTTQYGPDPGQIVPLIEFKYLLDVLAPVWHNSIQQERLVEVVNPMNVNECLPRSRRPIAYPFKAM